MKQPKKKAIVFIFFTVVLDISGLMVIFPIMPDILQSVGKFSVSDAAIWGGFLYASYALMQFLFSPVIGNISDAFGRRPVILISLLLMIIDFLILGFASLLWVFIIGRMIGGIAGGTVHTAMAYLADISTSEDKAKNFGLIGAAFGIGFVLGPFIGGILGEINFLINNFQILINANYPNILLTNSHSIYDVKNRIFLSFAKLRNCKIIN